MRKTTKSKNQALLHSFAEYCLKNPNQRFWQALRNWSDNGFVLVSDGGGMRDTFYSDQRDGK